MEQEALVPILKPCPFCGDRPQIVQTGTFAVQCADCGAMGPPAPNMERAAVRWNKSKGDDFGWQPIFGVSVDVYSSVVATVVAMV